MAVIFIWKQVSAEYWYNTHNLFYFSLNRQNIKLFFKSLFFECIEYVRDIKNWTSKKIRKGWVKISTYLYIIKRHDVCVLTGKILQKN